MAVIRLGHITSGVPTRDIDETNLYFYVDGVEIYGLVKEVYCDQAGFPIYIDLLKPDGNSCTINMRNVNVFSNAQILVDSV